MMVFNYKNCMNILSIDALYTKLFFKILSGIFKLIEF